MDEGTARLLAAATEAARQSLVQTLLPEGLDSAPPGQAKFAMVLMLNAILGLLHFATKSMGMSDDSVRAMVDSYLKARANHVNKLH